MLGTVIQFIPYILSSPPASTPNRREEFDRINGSNRMLGLGGIYARTLRSAIRGCLRYVRSHARPCTCAELAEGVIAEAPHITSSGHSTNMILAHVYLRPRDHDHAFRVGNIL